MKLSIVTPLYKEPYLKKLMADILKNSALGDQLEVIGVMDGYWDEDPPIDPRIKYVHLGRNRGMREAINAGVRVSTGEFFMRLDSHCMFDKGFDKKLTDACKENEIMTATRYFLDPTKWEVMDIEPVIYEKLAIQNVGDGVRKFAGKPWRARDKERKDVMIDETQAMQGSMWIANREFFLKTVGELQTEGYGPAYQDSVEVCMKYWKVGGRLMVNKNTWFAHKHRSFARSHNEGTKENPWIREKSWTYALEQWEKYYNDELTEKWKK